MLQIQAPPELIILIGSFMKEISYKGEKALEGFLHPSIIQLGISCAQYLKNYEDCCLHMQKSDILLFSHSENNDLTNTQIQFFNSSVCIINTQVDRHSKLTMIWKLCHNEWKLFHIHL